MPHPWFRRSVPLAVVAMGGAGLVHLALLVRRGGASSVQEVPAALAWALAIAALATEGPLPRVRLLPSLAGLCLVLFGLLQAARMEILDPWFEPVLPCLLFGGVQLLSVGGGREWLRRWRTATLVVVMAMPDIALEGLLNAGNFFTLIQARTAALTLHLAGFEVQNLGTLIALPNGIVDVKPHCTGVPLVVLLLKLSLILCVGLRLSRRTLLTLAAAALGVGFGVGIVRILTLALVVHKPAIFTVLHGSTGGLIFSTLGMLLFAKFLVPVEDPLVLVLRDFGRAWTQAPTRTAPALALSCAVFLVWGCTFFFRPDWGRRVPDYSLGALPAAAVAGHEFKPVPITTTLLLHEQPTVHAAWRSSDARTEILICAMGDTLGAGDWIGRKPELLAFFQAQFEAPAVDLAQTWKALVVHPIHGGQVGWMQTPTQSFMVAALNETGQVFFTTDDYKSGRLRALRMWPAWKRWLLEGKALKSTHYWLFIERVSRPAPAQ